MKRGFTLVEMLVVMAIISILSVVVLTDYEWGGHQQSLKRSASNLKEDLRTAQEMAMSARSVPGGVPPGGYGVYLDRLDGSYTIFAEMNLNYTYDVGDDVLISVTSLEEDIIISSMCLEDPSGGGICHGDLSITFTPPDPTIRFLGGEDKAQAIIDLTSLKTEEVIQVIVNRSGLVIIQ